MANATTGSGEKAESKKQDKVNETPAQKVEREKFEAALKAAASGK